MRGGTLAQTVLAEPLRAFMMKVAAPTEKRLSKVLPSSSAIATTTPRMAASPPTTRTPHNSSGQLSREQVDALLSKLRDPSLARKFLMDAGLIDADGQLTPPYRRQDAQTA
jgi:hypothetical protein